jgi:transposase
MASVVYGGLDVHKGTIVAFLFSRETGEIVEQTIPNDRKRLLRAVRRWQEMGELRLCYEASGAGYVLKRWLDAEGVACDVIAPSKTPRAPGERVKTDRRDARKLAQLHAAGLLTTVRTPSVEEEQVRAVVRLRYEVTQDMTRVKNRVVKHLGRLGIRYQEGRNWTQKHRRWLASLSLDPAEALILRMHLDTLNHLEVQREEIDREIERLAATAPYAEGVQRLMCLRGIGLYSAMVLLTEIGDIRRFGGAPQLMSYFGLIPSEDSSADHRRLGVITKTGNWRARWILGQAAWKQRYRPGSERLRRHWKTQPLELVAIGRKAEKRLNHTYWKIALRKDRRIAATAVAREMAGFVWALLSEPCAQGTTT